MEIYKQLTYIDYLVIVFYLVLLLMIGFWVSFSQKGSKDLFLAGKNLKWVNIGLSMWGTNVSPSMMIASAGLAYTSGVVGGNFSWLAFPLLFLLAMFFMPVYLKAKVSTLPEFIKKRFDKNTHKIVSWYTLITILISWLGSNLYVGGLLMSQIMNFPLWLSLLILVSIATSFTVTGGLTAVVITDSFQMVLLIFTSLFLTIAGLVQVGGINELIASVPENYWQLLRTTDESYPWYALILGYPVIGLWFWCSDQTIVQRALGAKNLRQSQLGINFTGWLKILDVFIFILPGIIAWVLFPGIENSDKTYMIMVVNLMPVGMIGLTVAVLMAAIISTVDSGLNSLSTVLTLDIYKHNHISQEENGTIYKSGKIITLIGAILAYLLSYSFSLMKGLDLFSLLQAIISFVAPPMAVVFLIGLIWKNATAKAANFTLIFGAVLCLFIGTSYLFQWPSENFWPHFLLLSFLLFILLSITMVSVSLFDKKNKKKRDNELFVNHYKDRSSDKRVWWLWLVLGIVMISLYIIFN